MGKILTVLLIFLSTLSFSQSNSQKQLHIFGGSKLDVYLGCLTCDDYSIYSIWNSYVVYGNNLNAISIWNSNGIYGGSHSMFSPFTRYATTPPVVVDKDGNFYGYFTINNSNDKRCDAPLALTIYKSYDIIRNDVAKWYLEIFKKK